MWVFNCLHPKFYEFLILKKRFVIINNNAEKLVQQIQDHLFLNRYSRFQQLTSFTCFLLYSYMYIVQFLACCRTFNSECFFRLHFIVVNFCSVTHVVCVNIPILSVPHSFCSSRSYCVNENILTPCSLNLLKYDVSTFKITLSPTQNEITFIFNTTSIYECCM